MLEQKESCHPKAPCLLQVTPNEPGGICEDPTLPQLRSRVAPAATFWPEIDELWQELARCRNKVTEGDANSTICSPFRGRPPRGRRHHKYAGCFACLGGAMRPPPQPHRDPSVGCAPAPPCAAALVPLHAAPAESRPCRGPWRCRRSTDQASRRTCYRRRKPHNAGRGQESTPRPRPHLMDNVWHVCQAADPARSGKYQHKTSTDQVHPSKVTM